MARLFAYNDGKSPHISLRLRPLRSDDEQRASVWTTLQPEDTVPNDHPLRPLRAMLNAILVDSSSRVRATRTCSATSTSRWTERSSRHGRVTRASARSPIVTTTAPSGATKPSIFAVPSAATRRTFRRRTPTRGSIERVPRRRRFWVIWGHALRENRHGLIIDVETTRATGTAEREAAITMLQRLRRGDRITVGADKAYDTADFVARVRDAGGAARRPERCSPPR